MKTLQAFHNKKTVKNKYIKRVEAHAKTDAIIKGKYWEDGKGCAVGCTIEGDDHSKYETELGIPKEVAYLEDVIFEELPNDIAKGFPLRFLNAVKVGANLSKVVANFVIWQFEGEKYGLKNIKEVTDDNEVLGFCEEVVVLYKRTLVEKVSEDEFYDLYIKIDKAGAGAWAGAWAEAWAGAGAGAWAGAWAEAWAWAGARAWAGAWAWAWAGAGAGAGAEYNARVIVMADTFIELIEKAPIIK